MSSYLKCCQVVASALRVTVLGTESGMHSYNANNNVNSNDHDFFSIPENQLFIAF